MTFDGRVNLCPDLRAGTASITTDGSGIATITHAHGFVPSGAHVQAVLAASPVFVAPYDPGSWTTTTFKVRAWAVSTGAAYTGSLSTVHYLMWR